MTFSKEIIEDIAVDTSDDWQVDDSETVSVAFFSDRISNMVCRFFGYESYDQFGEAWQDGWIDRYAIIDPVKGLVTGIYSIMVLNANDTHDMELNIKITNPVEGKMIFDQLIMSGGEDFKNFITESADEIKYGHFETADGVSINDIKVGDKLYESNCFGDVFEKIVKSINKPLGLIDTYEVSIDSYKTEPIGQLRRKIA